MNTPTRLVVGQRLSPGELYCPVCSQPVLPRAAVEGYPLHACSHCGLEHLFPQPDESVLAEIYNEHYFLGAEDEQASARRGSMKSATGALYVDALARLMRPEKAQLFEVGCG